MITVSLVDIVWILCCDTLFYIVDIVLNIDYSVVTVVIVIVQPYLEGGTLGSRIGKLSSSFSFRGFKSAPTLTINNRLINEWEQTHNIQNLFYYRDVINQ